MANISNRLAIIIATLNISTRAFEHQIGCSNGVIARCVSKDTDISSFWLSKIIEAYPDISADWLLAGNGDMFKKKLLPHLDQNLSETSILLQLYKEEKEKVEALSKLNGGLQEANKRLEEENKNLKNEISSEKYFDKNTSPSCHQKKNPADSANVPLKPAK